MAELNCTAITDPTVSAMCEQFLEMQSAGDVNDGILSDGLNTFFLLWAGSLVFQMHLGFAMLSSGCVRSKNSRNILLSIVIDATICAIAFYLIGYGLAYGESANGFIGTSYFAGNGMNVDYSYTDWFFQFCFAATSATIVSGAIAERATFESYASYSFLISVFVYPVTVHWVWSGNGNGWLSLGPDGVFGVGALDFAGCGPVHLVGAVAGAIGSKFIGPRVGRYDAQGNVIEIPGHSSPQAVLGTFILWVGWFGFNPGSVLSITGNASLAGRAAVSTLLSSAGGALASLSLTAVLLRAKEWSLMATLNGCLAGLVSITSGASVVEPWAGIISGLIGGSLYVLGEELVLRVFKIDDPLGATAVHGVCGIFGLIFTGFFAVTEYVNEFQPAFAEQGIDHRKYSGIFYGGNGLLLAANLIEAITIMAWVAAIMSPYFFTLKRLNWLRVSREAEHVGLDQSSHGGSAYPEQLARDELEKHTSSMKNEKPDILPSGSGVHDDNKHDASLPMNKV